MAPKGHEREVMYADVIVHRRAEQAPFPPLKQLAGLWARAHRETLAPKTFEGGTVTAIIADCNLADETITVLISVADPNASNATYADHSKRQSRTIAKKPTEGNEYSAHVVVSLKERVKTPNTYACLIERMPSIGVARIQSVLNDVISRYCKSEPGTFTYKGAGGQKTAKSFVPNVVISLIASEDFVRDIESGELSGLKLSRPAVSSAGTSMGPYLIPQDYSLNVKVSRDLPKGQRWQTIKSAIMSQSGNYSKARIYLKPVDAASSTSVEFDTSTGSVLGEGYARKSRISPLSPLLQNGSPFIVKHLEARMLKLLEAET